MVDTIIKNYRSSTPGARPSTLAPGQIAINDADRVICYKDASGTIREASLQSEAEIQAMIDTAVSGLIGGAPAALDTLNEIAAAINDDQNFAASFTASLGGKVDKSQLAAQMDAALGSSDWRQNIALDEGANNQRTFVKGDAGQIGSKSGFFETGSPVNFYPGAVEWQHLIDCRYSSTAFNYSMQIAGSFSDQEFWGRKTMNEGAAPWVRFWHSGNLDPAALTGPAGATGPQGPAGSPGATGATGPAGSVSTVENAIGSFTVAPQNIYSGLFYLPAGSWQQRGNSWTFVDNQSQSHAYAMFQRIA